MTRQARVLAVIPARGGSKGLPGKNTLAFAGKPLIAWTIEAARACAGIDRVILSSDDDHIMQVAAAHGCDVPFRRAAQLATDEARSADVVLDALARCPGYDVVVLLQPTSPLRSAADIEGALDLFLQSGAKACVSVCDAPANPHWMYSLDDGKQLVPLLGGAPAARRQDLPQYVALNGAIYIADVAWFKEKQGFLSPATIGYAMPASRSMDIDTKDDFDMAEFVALRSLGKCSGDVK